MARGTIRQRSTVRKDSWTVQVYTGVDPETGKKHYHSEAVKGTKALAPIHRRDEGRGVVLLCIWDNGFRERKPTRNKEHPTDATT